MPFEVAGIAMQLAGKLGVRIPSRNYLLSEFTQEYPLPAVIDSNGYRVWLDRYYIAYLSPEDEIVHYVYVAKEHILEEYGDRMHSRPHSHAAQDLPDDIAKAFKYASERMQATGKEYCLFA